eukprot:CAMPEP_0113877660 /NCGR_PEP_ID=MMETSP0780_2-20120614/6226_1 /TAXON_ID=652834 /ORGANISM="Palpitomonas bilix" /LENGTH=60 /DNA_ID=CAMNT_0000863995 /DNA_START=24 /DNA_END=206 /DNA_ORIENTATION=+ /assembly_acc=CAM_ASM_000599
MNGDEAHASQELSFANMAEHLAEQASVGEEAGEENWNSTIGGKLTGLGNGGSVEGGEEEM